MIKTALTLTETELKRMATYVRQRMEALEAARSVSWVAERERFEREWNDDFSHRGWENAVFAKSNESLNMIGSGVDYIRARIMDEIFGSKPWFASDFRSKEGRDALLSEQVQKHLRWKLGVGQIDFEAVASDLVTQACKLGECVAKIFYRTDEEVYERVASILWECRGDRPVVTPEGDVVFAERWNAMAPPERIRLLWRNEGVEEEWRPGQCSEGSEKLPEGFCWKEQIVSEHAVRYAGAKAVPLHYKEFFCPLNAPSLQEADFVAHRTVMRLSALSAHLGVERLEGAGEEGTGSYLQEVLMRIRQAGGRGARSEQGAAADEVDPEFALLEAYFDFDVREDGRCSRVYLMTAYELDLPIFWDYIANVTPGGLYPFEAVVVNKEPHRWYGKSWFGKYDKFQHLIDKLLNQILYRNELAANPVKFRRKEAVLQWQDDQVFEIGPDKVFDLNDGYTAEDALQTAKIPELDEQTKYLLEMVIATWRTRSGVSTATQGTFANLPSERTAAGVAHIVESGATLFRPQVMEVKRGLEAILRQVVAYQYACQMSDESFVYLDGETRVEGVLCWQDLQDMDLSVELTLTRSKQLRNLDAVRMAVDFFGKFLAVPDRYKAIAAPLYASVYKNLEIENADQYFHQIVRVSEPVERPEATGEGAE